jgi:hypothetical protein
MHQLANGLHVHLTTNRRAAGDHRHFKFYTSLYKEVGGFPASAVERARAAYPWDGNDCDLTLVLSHHKRRRINRLYNEERDGHGVFVACDEAVSHHNQPQDMYIRPGMQLLCCCRSHRTLVNGVFYQVEAVDDTDVVVRMADAYTRDRSTLDDEARKKADQQEGLITLPHKEASKALRLTYALCYASVQGLTLRDKSVLMLDLDSGHFSVRTLIVGLSRVTKASDISVASAEQEMELMGMTKSVPLPRKVAEEDCESDREA